MIDERETATVISSYVENTVSPTQVSSYAEDAVPPTHISSHADMVAPMVFSPQGDASEKDRNGWGERLSLRKDSVVEGYKIVGYISKSGESEVYRAQKDGRDYAFKLYDQKLSLKKDVVEKLWRKDLPYLAYMADAGETKFEYRDGEYATGNYEVSPLYYKVKDHMTYPELKEYIRQVNEGLHALHKINIFHQDIKPSNILVDEDGNYRIIDFGISSVAEEGQTQKITTRGITLDYASPERRANQVASSRGDYYSFGITLYNLFTGELPYQEFGSHNERYRNLMAKGIKVRPDQNIPKDFEKLLHGLTFYSSNETLCRQRWGYEEIKNWLQDPDSMKDLDMEKLTGGAVLPVADDQASYTYKEEFNVNGKRVIDSMSLADALGSSWEIGKKYVGRRQVEEYLKNQGGSVSHCAGRCMDVREILDDDSASEWKRNIEFWKLLYVIEPNLKTFYWYVKKEDGSNAYTKEELAALLIIKALQQGKSDDLHIMDTLIRSHMISEFIEKQLQDMELKQRVYGLEEQYGSSDGDDSEMAAWELAYLLTKKAVFYYDNTLFSSKESLYRHLIEWTNQNGIKASVMAARQFPQTVEFKACMKYWEENK